MDLDPGNLQEYGVVMGFVYAVWFLTKVLGMKFSFLNGGGHAKRSADAAEKQLKNTEETNVMLKEMQSSQHRVEDAHLDQFARRPDGTPKWHNTPEMESNIKDTHENTRAILRKVNSMNE